MASLLLGDSRSRSKEILNNIIIELFKKGTTDEIAGFRRSHEKIAGTTEKQMIMAGVVKTIPDRSLVHDDQAAAQAHLNGCIKEYDDMDSQYNLVVEYEKIRHEDGGLKKKGRMEGVLEQFEANVTDPSEELLKKRKVAFWMKFKKYYSWFTGRKMHRELKGGELLLTGNEDEHVLPFGFMLLFGGGIARVIDSEETKKREDIEAYLKIVEKTGMDPAFISYILTNKNATDLLTAMGYDDMEKRYKFCLRLHQINYYGYFLSEGKANTVKTNHLLIKLEKTEGGFKFSPSKNMIEKFIDNMYLWSQTMNYEKCEELEKKMKEEDKNVQPTAQGQHYNGNKVKLAYLPRGWRSSGGGWNPDVAKGNMEFILDKLCGYLNEDIEHRLFFNIVMSGIYLKEKITKTLTTTAKTAEIIASVSSTMARQHTISPGKKPPQVGTPSKVMVVDSDDEEENENLAKNYFEEYLEVYPEVKQRLKGRDLLGSSLTDRIKDAFDPNFFVLESVVEGGKKKKSKGKKKKKRTKKKRRRRKKTRGKR